jgi:hypothetical protein
MKDKGYRNIPIGFADNSVARSPPLDREYLSCSNTSIENADFYTAAVDSVCSNDEVRTAIDRFRYASSNSSIPIFTTFYGEDCKNRSFFEQDIIFDDRGEVNTFSGVFLAWRFTIHDAGLVDYNRNLTTTVDNRTLEVATPLEPAFSNLQKKWKTIQPTGVQLSTYTPSSAQPACPTFQDNVLGVSGRTWKINGSVPLPTQGQVFDMELRMSWERGMNNTVKKKNNGVRKGAGPYYVVIPIAVLAFGCIFL